MGSHEKAVEVAPGTKFGPYEVAALLGAGGMGAVYRARDPRLQRDVALKIIRAHWSADDVGRRRRFESEARLAARLTHPNVVAIYDVGEANDQPYLVTELITGGTLGDTLSRGPLARAEALPIAVAIAEGLAEAHRQGIVHRDLKPDNVLMTRGNVPKISDFGLSKLLAPDTGDGDQQTTAVGGAAQDGAIAGTPAYMSPEQAAGKPTDFRSDQFSFGSLLVEMLTGRRPFQKSSALHTIAAVIDCDTDAALQQVPPDIARILRRCLARDPAKRYGSTDDLVHDLRELHAPKRLVIPLVAAALAVIALIAAIALWRPAKSVAPAATGTPKITSLAILPLSNFSGDHAQDYFADAMTEEITAQVAGLRSLRVMSRTSANAYRGTTKPLSTVARELGVDGVIEGSVIRTGDRARVTVQLIDGDTDRHLWSQSFERTGSDVLSLQRDVAREIAQQLSASLSPAEQAELRRLPTKNPAAYDAYLHAQYTAPTVIGKKESAENTLRNAEEAVRLDPDFAEAWVLIAKACQGFMFTFEGGKEYDEKAYVAIQKALTINPSLAEAYHVRGGLNYNSWHGFNIAAAVADYRRALALNPNLADAHHSLGSELTHLGLHDDAIREFRIALRLDPRLPGPVLRIPRALWQSNHFAEAIETYERTGQKVPEKAVALAFAGRLADGRKAVMESIASNTNTDQSGDQIAVLALLDAMDGKRQASIDETKRAFDASGRFPHFHHAAFWLAAAAAERGDTQAAVHWLEFMEQHGMPNYPLFRDNPSMQKLRGRREYDEYMKNFLPRWEEIVRQSSGKPQS